MRDQEAVDVSSRIFLVDVLRSLGILMVLAVHLGIFRAASGIPPAEAWIPLGFIGGYGVSVFFVISGFLITRVLVSPSHELKTLDLRVFYIQRIGRIWPLLFFTCLLGVSFMRWGAGRPQDLRVIFSAPVRLPGFWASIAAFSFNWYRIFTENGPNLYGLHWGVLWSLSVEEQYYLLYPILLTGLKSARAAAAFLSLVVLGGLAWRMACFLYQPLNYLLSITASFGAFDQIAMGCLLFFTHRRISRGSPLPRPLALAAAGTGGVLILLVLLFTNPNSAPDRVYGPTALSLGVFLTLLGGMQMPISETALTKALCLPGRLSYGLYLLHPAVMYVCAGSLLGKNPIAAYGLFVSINLAVAAAAFRFIERPANRLIRSSLEAPSVATGRKAIIPV